MCLIPDWFHHKRLTDNVVYGFMQAEDDKGMRDSMGVFMAVYADLGKIPRRYFHHDGVTGSLGVLCVHTGTGSVFSEQY